jgi:hypothetical protein
VTGPNVVVECPGDLAALIVQLHKETPDGRLFLAGFTAAGSVVTGTAHLGMTNPTDPAHLVRETTKLIGVLRRAEWGDTAMAALVAFGTTLVADPYLDLASGLVTHMAALPLVDVIRVCDGRYWSYTGDAPAEYARDSEGEEFDPLTDRAIEAATTIARAELGEPQ